MHDYQFSSRFVEVTPEEAARMYGESRYEGQRVIRPYHVERLGHAIAQGTFRPGTQIHFAITPDGRRHLVNGQHTLLAIAKGATNILLDIQEVLVPDIEDVHALFGGHDRGMLRSFNDIYHAQGVAERIDMGERQTEQLGSAMPNMLTGFSVVSWYAQHLRHLIYSAEFRIRAIEAWAPEARSFYSDISRGPKNMTVPMCVSGVLGLALVTYRFSPKNASIFWSDVAHDDRLPQDSPQKQLCEFLLTRRRTGLRAGNISRLVAGAWNAFSRGKTRKFLGDMHGDHPIFIEGTPHRGRTSADKHMTYIGPDGVLLYTPVPMP